MSVEDTDQEEQQRRGGGPVRFWNEVRAEARKVTWATRNEVMVSTIMVVVMGFAAAVFFFIVDSLLRFLIGLLLNAF